MPCIRQSLLFFPLFVVGSGIYVLRNFNCPFNCPCAWTSWILILPWFIPSFTSFYPSWKPLCSENIVLSVPLWNIFLFILLCYPYFLLWSFLISVNHGSFVLFLRGYLMVLLVNLTALMREIWSLRILLQRMVTAMFSSPVKFVKSHEVFLWPLVFEVFKKLLVTPVLLLFYLLPPMSEFTKRNSRNASKLKSRNPP